MSCVLLSAAACAPIDPLADVALLGPARCQRDLDCAPHEICNPGSLRCVEDVQVEPDAFAGTAWYVVAEDEDGVRSGQTKNVYVKARFGDRELVFDDIFAKDLLGRWFLNLGQATGDGRFSMAFTIASPPSGPGELTLDDDIVGQPAGGTAALGGHDEDYLVREYVAVTESGAVTIETYPAPLGALDQVRLRFSGRLDEIGPAAYLNYSTPCGTDAEGHAVGLYDGVEDRCQTDFEDTHVMAGLDCLYADEIPSAGGNANISFQRPPVGPWIEGADLGVRQEGKCQAGIKDGELLVVAYVQAGAHYLDLEIHAPLNRLATGEVVALSELNARLYEITPVAGGVESRALGRLGAGTLRVHRFSTIGDRQRLYLSVRGVLGGHLSEGEDCDLADDACRTGLSCQPSWAGGAWCMQPCRDRSDCAQGRACAKYQSGGSEYSVCSGLYGEYQSGCDPNPRHLEVCTGELSCTEHEGAHVCVDPCGGADPCPAGQGCGPDGFCVTQSPPYGLCDGAFRACQAGNLCVNLVSTGGGATPRCLKQCPETPCAADETCWPLPQNGPMVCQRNVNAFGSCSDARILDGYRCARGLGCVTDWDICMQSCAEQSCGGGQVCAGELCFRTLARLASCNDSVVSRGYYCATADLCVSRSDKPGTPSFCYARCGVGFPTCGSGSVCSTLSSGARACLTP